MSARLHCQCCGRAIHANTGVIAHHGYQRRWSSQIGSCMGSRYLPFEASRDRLADLIRFIKGDLVRLRNREADIAADAIALRFSYRKRHRGTSLDHYVEVTRDTFDDVRAAYESEMRQWSVYSFDALKQNATTKVQHRVRMVSDELVEQTARFDGWKQTLRWDGNTWETCT